MYKVTIKNLSDSSETIIYQNGSYETYIEKPKLSLEWGQPGSFSFTMLPGHASYDDMHPIITFIYVYWDDEELFFGRVLTIDKDLFGKKNIYCEGALNFLRDGQLLHSYDQNETVTNFLTWCLNELLGTNLSPSTIEPRKQFIVGDIDNSLASQTAHFKVKEYAEAKSTLDELLVNRFGGCLVVRKDYSGNPNPSGHTVNYLKTVGTTISDRIKICENVRDRTDHDSGESIFTVLRPIGANLGGDNDVPCILSDNGGVIEIADMVNKYGRIYKTENFSDQDTEAGLRAAAEAYIARLGMDDDDHLPKTCDIKYVDFHYLNPQIAKIGFGDVFTDIEGYEGQSMVVGHLELDLENPANDSMSLYNQAYLDAREYSALLESSTGAGTAKSTASGRSGGGGGSAIAKTLASATKAADTKTEEVKEHFEHKTTETNKELHDCYHILGVKLDEDTHLPERDPVTGELVWAGEEDDAAEIWGTMTRNAWETIINHKITDEQGNEISYGEILVDAYGNLAINAINNQTGEGTLYVNANKIKLSDGGDGSPEILTNYLDVNADGYISLKATTIIEGDILLTGNGDKKISGVSELVVGSGDQDQTPGTAYGTFTYRGEDFNIKPMRMGTRSPFILAVRMLTTSANDIDLNHSHAITMTEETSGAHSGEVHAIIGAPVSYSSSDESNRESFFDIAASQTYIDGVAARTADSISNIVLSTPYPIDWVFSPTVTVTSSDGNSELIVASVDASGVYTAGFNDAVNLVRLVWYDSYNDAWWDLATTTEAHHLYHNTSVTVAAAMYNTATGLYDIIAQRDIYAE